MARKTSKKQIIEQSWDVFSNNSFFSLSMQDIAKELGIKKPLLFYYFESKTQLFYEVISENINKFFSQFEIIFNSKKSCGEKIQELSRLYLSKFHNKSIVNAQSHHINKIDNSITSLVASFEDKLVSCFEEIFRQGIALGEFKQTDPKNLSLALLGYLEKIKYNNIKTKTNWLDFLYK